MKRLATPQLRHKISLAKIGNQHAALTKLICGGKLTAFDRANVIRAFICSLKYDTGTFKNPGSPLVSPPRWGYGGSADYATLASVLLPVARRVVPVVGFTMSFTTRG